jgi:hypothetical protein
MSPIGEMLPLSGGLSFQRLDKISETLRLRIHRPKVLREERRRSVIGETVIALPIGSSELHKKLTAQSGQSPSTLSQHQTGSSIRRTRSPKEKRACHQVYFRKSQTVNGCASRLRLLRRGGHARACQTQGPFLYDSRKRFANARNPPQMFCLGFQGAPNCGM